MGIAGLARRLEPYAVRYTPEELKGRTAVIDGPALAFNAHRLAVAASANLSRVPTYAECNAEAMGWLKSLESIDIKVSAILFDGALPASKKDERVSRLEQNTKRLAYFRASYPTAMCPIPNQLGSTTYGLLAPALMEELRSSEFAQVTQIVPGEADDWCAASCSNHNHRSIIFTSDTDLILYNYPSECIIIFFKDVNLLPHPEFKAYTPTSICKRLNLKLSGLLPLAYSIIQEPWKSLNENIKESHNCNLESEAYLDFSKRYITKAPVPLYITCHPEMHEALQKLDARVSELVHQAIDHHPIPNVYLPTLFEDPNQASAWNFGQDLRLVAYSLLSPTCVVIQEYKRKAQSVTVEEQVVLPQQKIQSSVTELANNVATYLLRASSLKLPQELIWPIFAVTLAIPHFRYPPTVSQLVHVVYGDFDNTWEFVHLTARIHAVLYSLRMLKQCLEIWIAISKREANNNLTLCNGITSLSGALESLPAIANLFIIPGQPIKEQLVGEKTLREAFESIYVEAGVQVPEEHSTRKQRKKERKAREKVEKKSQFQQGNAKKSGAGTFNVFDILNC